MEEKIVGKCIKCGGDVVEKEKYYVCKNRKEITKRLLSLQTNEKDIGRLAGDVFMLYLKI